MKEIPLFSSGIPVLDDAFSIAVGDLCGNVKNCRKGLLKHDAPVLMAGLSYKDAWTRDAAINVWNGLSFVMPEVSRNTLLSVLEEKDGHITIGGDLNQYWDSIIWAVGAWHYYLTTGDLNFLQTAYSAIVNSLKQSEEKEFDESLNLFRGPACYGDGISAYPDIYAKGADAPGAIKRWPKKYPELAAKKGFGLPMHSLSTNILFFAAYEIADKIEKILGASTDFKALQKSCALKEAINRHFWIKESGRYRYLVDPFGGSDAQEGLGTGFALLFNIPDNRHALQLIDNQHITRYGIPCLWPSFKRYINPEQNTYGRHCGPVWPHISGFWAEGVLKHGRTDLFERELTTLAAQAVKYGQFNEIYHPDTGVPYGGEQENYKGESCKRQSWCASAFVRMVLTGVVGMELTLDGMKLNPSLPTGCNGVVLQNIHYRDALLNIDVHGRGSSIKACLINGVPVDNRKIPISLSGVQNIILEMK